MLNLQNELANQKQKYQNDISAFEKELKYLREEKGKLEKEIKDANGACNVLETKNKSLENVVDVCKKNEVSTSPDIVYINTGKAEHNFDVMICFLD